MAVPIRPLFVRPSDALDDVSERPSLLGPGLILFALGVVMALQSAPLMAVAFEDVPRHSVHLATRTGLLSVASAAPLNLAFNVAFAFAPWLLVATLTHAGARLAGGTGTPRQTLASVAWCAVPWILVYGSIVLVAAVIAATSETTLAAALGGHALEFVPGEPPAYFDSRGVLDLRNGLYVVGVTLSARIWARAVPSAHGDGLERGSAVVSGAVGTLLVALVFL